MAEWGAKQLVSLVAGDEDASRIACRASGSASLGACATSTRTRRAPPRWPLIKAKTPISSNVSAGEVYPGGPGIVIREQDGERMLQGMSWGFPLARKSKKRGQPQAKRVNNMADLTSFMWRFVAPRPEHRCLIPLTGFCDAERMQGAMIRG